MLMEVVPKKAAERTMVTASLGIKIRRIRKPPYPHLWKQYKRRDLVAATANLAQ